VEKEELDGATMFERGRDSMEVVPRTGMALVFYHKMLHEGAVVLKGRKYVLRTDVMYRRARFQGDPRSAAVMKEENRDEH